VLKSLEEEDVIAAVEREGPSGSHRPDVLLHSRAIMEHVDHRDEGMVLIYQHVTDPESKRRQTC
jgi:hypothetical protein